MAILQQSPRWDFGETGSILLRPVLCKLCSTRCSDRDQPLIGLSLSHCAGRNKRRQASENMRNAAVTDAERIVLYTVVISAALTLCVSDFVTVMFIESLLAGVIECNGNLRQTPRDRSRDLWSAVWLGGTAPR
jgi:hypothetical protein